MEESLVIKGWVSLSSKAADLMVQAAKKKANDINIPMCVAVVDPSGYLMAFSRCDNARLANIKMATTKAISAAVRQRATADELKIRPEDPIQTVRTSLAAGSDYVTSLSGGIPIYVEGTLIGAIGVSGGHREQDILVAAAGLSVLGLP